MKPIASLLALSLAVTPLLHRASHAAPIPDQYKQGGFAIGCQAWSFNKFTAFEAIERTAAAGGRVIEFFPGQKMMAGDDTGMGPGMSDDAVTKLQDKLKQHGVKAVAFGVTGISRDAAEARRLFEWAKKLDIGILNTESTDAIDTFEPLAKEFDIKVGFHNHPKTNDPNYKVWNPEYILSIVKNRDSRIGACADTGHWVRSGIKPIDALRILRGRIVSSHLKDLHEFSPGGHDMPYGQGVSDVPAILDELKAQNFGGSVSVEYEYNWDNSLPEIAQCIGFVRAYGMSQMKQPKRVANLEDRVMAPTRVTVTTRVGGRNADYITKPIPSAAPAK